MKSMSLSLLPTPALLLDLDAMEANLQRMAAHCGARGIGLRPHFKNHRVLALTRRQLDARAIGITCARLWQAELLVGSGVTSILLANEIVGEARLRELVDLGRQVELIAAVDNPKVVDDLARIARNHKTRVRVVVDIDLGLRRCGVQPGEQALQLAQHCMASGLILSGIMGYEGHLQSLPAGDAKTRSVEQALRALLHSKLLIERAGIPVDLVSCGGTGDYDAVSRTDGITELQAGSYLLMDAWYAPFAPDFRQTLSVLTTVISKATQHRMVADAGVKVISAERGGIGSVRNRPDLKVVALHAEHALLESLSSAQPIEVGDQLELPVQYHDGTIQLHRTLYGVRNGVVEQAFRIEHSA